MEDEEEELMIERKLVFTEEVRGDTVDYLGYLAYLAEKTKEDGMVD
jgi:hypothetical protein